MSGGGSLIPRHVCSGSHFCGGLNLAVCAKLKSQNIFSACMYGDTVPYYQSQKLTSYTAQRRHLGIKWGGAAGVQNVHVKQYSVQMNAKGNPKLAEKRKRLWGGGGPSRVRHRHTIILRTSLNKSFYTSCKNLIGHFFYATAYYCISGMAAARDAIAQARYRISPAPTYGSVSCNKYVI